MATGLEVESLQGYLAREQPKSARAQVLTGLQNAGNGLSTLLDIKTLLDTVVADASTAGEPENALEAVQTDWGSNLATVVSASFSYGGKSGINALAQLIADLSDQAGLNNGNNRLRLFKGASGSEAIVPVDQDA